MRARYAQIILGFSLLLLLLVVFDFIKISTPKKEEPTTQKPNLVSMVNDLGKVLPGETGGTYYYKFYLKDNSALQITSSGTGQSSYISGATIKVNNKSAFTCGEGGTNHTFAYFDGLYKLICNEAATMNITISKSGYNTKTTNLAYYQGEIPTITLTKYSPPPPSPPAETIKTISLPAEFKETGSETTDLSKIADPAKVDDLTLDTKKHKVKFKETVDLSATDTKNKFKELEKYVITDQIGKLTVDSGSLPVLNKTATITMKGLNFVKTPKVLVDGKEDKTVVSNIQYKDGVLSFDVTHFSTFTAAPTVGINEPADKFENRQKEITLKGSVSDPTASVSAKLNNRDLGKLKVATDTGKFEKLVDLDEGANKLVVSALAANGATAVATVSGNLVKAVNSLTAPLSILLAALAFLGIAAALWAARMLWRSKKGSKPPTPPIS